MAGQRRTVAQETKEARAQDMETEKSALWRVGADGWINSPVV